MIDYENLDIKYGIHIIPEYYVPIIIPELTLKQKIKQGCRSILSLIKEIAWIAIASIGLCLQVGSLAYIAGLMFMKGAS